MGIKEWFIEQSVKLGNDRAEVIAVLDEQGLSNRGLAYRVTAAKEYKAGVDELKKMKDEADKAALNDSLNDSLFDTLDGKVPIAVYIKKLEAHIQGKGPDQKG